jgi:hypothetical protein
MRGSNSWKVLFTSNLNIDMKTMRQWMQLCETDTQALRTALIKLAAKLPARWKESDGGIAHRNPRFDSWLAAQPDDKLAEIQINLEQLLANLKANPQTKLRALSPARPSKAQLISLRAMLPRAGREFIRYLRDLYDDKAEMQQCQNDPKCLLDTFEDYLKNEHSIRIRRDGLITFYHLTKSVRTLIGDLPVALYHYTASRVIRSIRDYGLEGDRETVNNREVDGVYLTTEQSGPAVTGYVRRAITAHGGYGVRLTVKCYLDELEPDPDDAGIASGRMQYVISDVPPERIVKVEKASP